MSDNTGNQTYDLLKWDNSIWKPPCLFGNPVFTPEAAPENIATATVHTLFTCFKRQIHFEKASEMSGSRHLVSKRKSPLKLKNSMFLCFLLMSFSECV